jgi:hypothetical protein
VGGSNSPVTDAAGVVWQTRSIAEAMATVSIYTLLFAVALSVAKLVQMPAVAAETSVEAQTVVSGRRESQVVKAKSPTATT